MKIEVVYVDQPEAQPIDHFVGDGRPAKWIPGSAAYHPLLYMARLAAEFLEAELITLNTRSFTLAEKLSSIIPRRRRGLAGLMICRRPADLASILLVKNWRGRYDRLVAWVFDSFWPNHVHRFVRLGRIFDHVFVAEREDLTSWRKIMHAPVDWLPWGADALRIGSPNPERPIDLVRFGRQPPDWDDDSATALMCESMQLRFQGRPPVFSDASESQRSLMTILSHTKFTLSFTNLVSPSVQTHPEREYITARWTDALSAGATVAGIPPRSDSVRALLWEGSLLDLGTVNRAEGLAVVASAVRDWTPERALRNYLRSLEVLDWRLRFERLASALDVHPPPTLEAELKLLRKTIKECNALA
jgi:hypothetical protein